MTELRDYQLDLLKRTQAALADPAAGIMMQLPTGGGKTLIAAALLSGWLQDGRKAVWLTHRRELASQTEGMLREAGVPASSNISWTPHTYAPMIANGVVILMAQTVSRRAAGPDVWYGYDYRDLMIIDEAHHATAGGWTRAISQWPGPVLGMTATPWRLSRREGFEHLFGQLHCGPQVADLQADNWLCRARVLSPPEEELIVGGQVDTTGDYSDSGIELANRDRDVFTAGTLRFWQKHGENRQTIIYAVSVKHAENLAAVFNSAGVSAGVLLGGTLDRERENVLYQFRYGGIRVLINVLVATEGFDLPDAACVVLTRPTLSLSLYLQMVGRGLRPKEDAGDCVVLDLAGNSQRHGLPEEEHEWSLKARGVQPAEEEMPLIRCPDCEELSPAGSHQCRNCGAPFGEVCGRCGAWRVWERWSLKTECVQEHDPVCDRCHYDAHIQAQLPVTERMRELADMQDVIELSPDRDPFLKDFLEEERRRLAGGNEEKLSRLRLAFRQRESELLDDDRMYHLFEQHLDALPQAQYPANPRQKSVLYVQWEEERRAELAGWTDEIAALEARPIDGQQVFDSAKERLMQLFEAEAREAGLLTQIQIRENPAPRSDKEPDYPVSPNPGEWMTFAQLYEWGKVDPTSRISITPERLQAHAGKEIPVRSWADFLLQTVEWLVREGLLTAGVCPLSLGRMHSRYLINTETAHPTGGKFRKPRQLSNGLYLENDYPGKQIGRLCKPLVEKFGQDPAQFRVWLS